MNFNGRWLCLGLGPLSLLLSFVCLNFAHSQNSIALRATDQKTQTYQNPYGNCTEAKKLFSGGYQISLWAGPAREAAIAYTDISGSIHIYDSDDGIFGNGGNEGSWMPYAPNGYDSNPQLWGRYLAFSRTEPISYTKRSIMIVDLGLTGRNANQPDIVMQGATGDYFSEPRIMGWYTGEPYLSWVHYPSGGTAQMYACQLSQCGGGYHQPIGMLTTNSVWTGFVAPPMGQYPIQFWNEASLGQYAHVVTQQGGFVHHWPLGNGNEYLVDYSFPFVLTRDLDGVHISDVFSGFRAVSTRPPQGSRDLHGALAKRPVLGAFGKWDQVFGWIRSGIRSRKSYSEVSVHLVNGALPYHEIKIPVVNKTTGFIQIQIDREHVAFRDNTNGDVYYSKCSFNI